MQSKIL